MYRICADEVSVWFPGRNTMWKGREGWGEERLAGHQPLNYYTPPPLHSGTLLFLVFGVTATFVGWRVGFMCVSPVEREAVRPWYLVYLETGIGVASVVGKIGPAIFQGS